MHTTNVAAHDPARAGQALDVLRQGGPTALAQALTESRRDTLRVFAAYEAALGAELAVPLQATLNPPRWELGHIGWFQEYWIARNPERALGLHANPEAARAPALRAGADALYNSSRVAHDTRWQLPLPDASATRADLARQLETTLQLLQGVAETADARTGQTCTDEALYFYRLALAHEDMHHEAALYMARALDIDWADPRFAPACSPDAPGELGELGELYVPAARLRLGCGAAGFAFDNEQPAQELELQPFRIDRCARRWREVLAFVDDGGYQQPRWWTGPGQTWLAASGACAPRYLRREGGCWLQRRHGRWQALELDAAAEHLNHFEAQAWCRWAGRRLPTEAEWEHAALQCAGDFHWGQVWEWTASPFAPYPGFVAHPYRDYSQPWFDGRPVLRGASCLTQPRLRHPRYRNFFSAQRNDIAAGLRSCALVA